MPEESFLVKGEGGPHCASRVHDLLAVSALGITRIRENSPAVQLVVKDRYVFTLSEYSVILGADNRGTETRLKRIHAAGEGVGARCLSAKCISEIHCR